MQRCEFITLLGSVAARGAERSSSRSWWIGFLNSASPDGYAPEMSAFPSGFNRRFSGSRIWRWRHGEDLEEDAPRYEPVVVDKKAEDEAEPEHEDAEQKRVDDGAIGIVVLEARYHHGSEIPAADQAVRMTP